MTQSKSISYEIDFRESDTKVGSVAIHLITQPNTPINSIAQSSSGFNAGADLTDNRDPERSSTTPKSIEIEKQKYVLEKVSTETVQRTNDGKIEKSDKTTISTDDVSTVPVNPESQPPGKSNKQNEYRYSASRSEPPSLTNGPITILRAKSGNSQLITRLRFKESESGRSYQIISDSDDEICSGKIPKSKTTVNPIHSNDFAIIARVFLIAKIHLLRKQLQRVLLEQQNKESSKSNVSQTTPISYTERIVSTIYPEEKSHIGWALRVNFIIILAAIWNHYHHSQQNIPEDLARITSPALLIICTIISTYIAGYLIAKTTGITPEDVKLRNRKNQHEELFKEFNNINRELTQTNLAVAACCFKVDEQTVVDNIPFNERWLRELDSDLKIKETVVSIEKVIIARQRDVDEAMQDYENSRMKSRRAIMSSVGGLAAGFITYEMGVAVKYFLQIGNQQDPISFAFWLEAIVQHGSAPGTYNQILQAKTGSKSECNTITNAGLQENKDPFLIELKNESGNIKGTAIPQTSDSTTTATEAISVKQCLEGYLRNHYQQPEMLSQAILLSVVLTISAAAAFISWKKGADGE